MAWTTPPTYKAGQLIAAADLNVVRDNLNASEAGVVTTLGDLLYASAAHTVARVAVGSAGQSVIVSGGLPAFGSPTTPLVASKQYNPAGTTYTAGTTYADVDATNLAVTFTAPGSGKVLVRLCAYAQIVGSTGTYFWDVREGSTDLTNGACEIVKGNSSLTTAADHLTMEVLITGISAGSHTYKWGHKAPAGTGTMQAGGAQGPAIIEIWTA